MLLSSLPSSRNSCFWLKTFGPCYLSSCIAYSTTCYSTVSRQAPVKTRFAQGRRYIHPRGPTTPVPVPEKKYDILFFGGDEFSCYTLRKLFESKDLWNTIDVVTQSDRRITQRGTKFVETPVKLLAQELGLRFHLMPERNERAKDMLFPSPFDQDIHPPNRVLIASSIGRFIPWKILQRFPPSRRLNVHPSMIPKYRGAAPIQWAIADGLKETGVSIIEVEKVGMGYDVGDIWAQKRIEIPEKSDFASLMPLLAEEGADLLIQVLRDMITGTQPVSVEQNPDEATSAPMIDATHALVDWWSWDADMIERRSRAISHQKPTFTYLNDEATTLQLFDVLVLEEADKNPSLSSPGTAIMNRSTGKLQVACAGGTQISVGKVKQQGRKLIPSKEWWIGVVDSKKPNGIISFSMSLPREESTRLDVSSV